MDNTAIQAIQDILARNDQIGVAVGKNPSLDDMGAALSLYLMLKQLGKQVTIACPTDPLVEISSLVGINKVRKSLAAEGGDLIVSFPYEEGEIEKVSYTLENGSLNIIVKPSGESLSFSEKDVEYKKSGNLPTALFVVGTARLSDLGPLFDPEVLKDATLINIDNKAENQGFGDVVLVSPKYSSVSEQVASLLFSIGSDIDLDTAQNLLSGISQATENFQSPRTSFLAFEITARLLQRGARRPELGSSRKQQTPDAYFQPKDPRPAQKPQPQPFPKSFGQQPRQNPQPRPAQAQPQRTQKSVVSDLAEVQKADEQKDEKDAPPDWLTPKVYKGSTLV